MNTLLVMLYIVMAVSFIGILVCLIRFVKMNNRLERITEEAPLNADESLVVDKKHKKSI
jgi:hypothetical protein